MSAKTMRRSSMPADDDTTTGNLHLDKILDAGTADAFKRQWHRLERGLRLNRLRVFADEEARRAGLSDSEKAGLLVLLQKALDKKMLNSKTTVVYDHDTETIKEIKGLVAHRAADGQLKYQFVERRAPGERRPGVTMRRKRTDSEA